MPRDSLRALVDKGDRERAVPSRIEPERLILPPRPPATTRRICSNCREQPTMDKFVARWLADNPPPPATCTIGQNGYVCSERRAHGTVCSNCVETTKRLHLASMTDARSMDRCPTCGGLLVEIVW